MARTKSKILTPAEQRIMDAVWTLKQASVGDVLQVVSATGAVAYTTVMTVLKVLEEKGYVSATRDGRILVYRAKVSREKAQTQALKHLVGEFFGGSRTALAQHLLHQEDLSRAELRSLETMVQAALAERKA
jgi:predicted transcriptional regulator